MKRYGLILFVLVRLGSASEILAQDKLPPNAKVVKLEVRPASIELKTPFEYRQLLVTGILDIGDRGGRRCSRAQPERSLMLLKPTGVVQHVGGVLMQPGDPHYRLIHGWISQGVKLDLTGPKVTKIEVTPAMNVIPLPGMKQQLTV